MSQREQIAYVRRDELPDVLPSRGFIDDDDDDDDDEPAGRWLRGLEARVAFGERGPLELDPRCKQLIPYVLLHVGGEWVWLMRRKRAQTEVRLHDRLSIGVGGHVERVDGDGEGGQGVIERAMWRELGEELCWGGDLAPIYRGVINDDETEVGQVHLGLLYTAHVEPRWMEQVGIREVEKMEGRWVGVSELFELSARLESWSSLLLRPGFGQWLTRLR